MPKRNRAKEQRSLGVQAPVVQQPTEQERAARLFAESVKAHEAADRWEQQRQRDEADRAARHVELREAKQAAADLIKRLRASQGKGQQVVEAEAGYRAALAALQEFETGERPHWAVASPPAEDGANAARSAEADGTDQDVHPPH